MKATDMISNMRLSFEQFVTLEAWKVLLRVISMVGKIMILKAYLSDKPYIAQLTIKYLLLVMCYVMWPKICRIVEWFVTFWTFKWFFSGVGSFMSRPVLMLNETFFTIRALERPLSCVDHYMKLEETFARKSLWTLIASKELFICVLICEMIFQPIFCGNDLGTHCTWKTFPLPQVSFVVFLKRSFLWKFLQTLRTWKRFFSSHPLTSAH